MSRTWSNDEEIKQFIRTNTTTLADVNTVRDQLKSQYQLLVDQYLSLTGSEKDKNDKLMYVYHLSGLPTLLAIEKELKAAEMKRPQEAATQGAAKKARVAAPLAAPFLAELDLRRGTLGRDRYDYDKVAFINHHIAHLILDDDDPYPIKFNATTVFGVSGNHSQRHEVVANVSWTKFGSRNPGATPETPTAQAGKYFAYDQAWADLVGTHTAQGDTPAELTAVARYPLHNAPPPKEAMLTPLWSWDADNYPFLGIYWVTGAGQDKVYVCLAELEHEPYPERDDEKWKHRFLLHKFLYGVAWTEAQPEAALRIKIKPRTLTGLLMSTIKQSLAEESFLYVHADWWVPVGRNYDRDKWNAAVNGIIDDFANWSNEGDVYDGIRARYARMVPDQDITPKEWIGRGEDESEYYGVWGLSTKSYTRAKKIVSFNDWTT